MRELLITGLLVLIGFPAGWAGIVMQSPVSVAIASTTPGDQPTMSDAQLLAQAGAVGILAVVLFFYRRDFMRKNDAEVQRTAEVVKVLEESTEAVTKSAVATARQTDATHRLARAVETIERRQAGLPPAEKGASV